MRKDGAPSTASAVENDENNAEAVPPAYKGVRESRIESNGL
jgi:hypothetical protein